MNCPTCGRTQLSEWPHDHRAMTPEPLTLPGPIPGSTLHVRAADPAPIRSCSVISWLLLSWAIAAVAGIALLVWWAW